MAFWLLGVALDLMLEALGDAKGLTWIPEWQGTARMGWMALPSKREHCFAWIKGMAKVEGGFGSFGAH